MSTKSGTAEGELRRISGESEMAQRIRAFDWSRTPLGPMHSWSETLFATLNFILSSPLPMQLF